MAATASYNIVTLVFNLQYNMFWHLKGALYYTLWSQLLVSHYTASMYVRLCVHSLHSYDCISSSLKQYSRCSLCNELMSNPDSLIPNVTCKSTSVPSSFSLIPLCFSSEWSYLQILQGTRSRTSSRAGGDNITVYTLSCNDGSSCGFYAP